MNYIYITGTSKGLGKAIAETLLTEPDNIVYGLARTCTIEHARYQHVFLDLAHAAEVIAHNFEAKPDAGKLVLINNAGMIGEIKHLGHLDAKTLNDTFQVNLASPAVLINSFVKAYGDTAAEKLVINITSGAATSPYDGWSAYCSTKAGIDMLTRVGEEEQMADGLKYPIRFLAIAPGVLDTEMQNQIRSSDATGFSKKQRFMDMHTEGQLYQPEVVAARFADIIEILHN